MKLSKTSVLAVVASATFLASGGSLLANPNFNNNYDLLMHFQSGNVAETDVVVAGLGNQTLTSLRDQGLAQTGNYTNLANINGTLTTAYGVNWATATDLFAGAVGTRSTSPGDGVQLNTGIGGAATAGDPRRTIYYTQVRTSNLLPGQVNSTSVSFALTGPGDAQFNLVNDSIFAPVQNRFETLSGASVISDRTAAATLGEGVLQQNPIGNNSYQNISTVQGAFSTAFTFGAAGGNVVLALDLFRMKPNTIASGVGEIDPSNPDHQGLFLGNIVLKNTGEVGFIAAVPEPSTTLLMGLGLAVALFSQRRRRAATFVS